MSGVTVPFRSGIDFLNQGKITGLVDPLISDPSGAVNVNFLLNTVQGLKDPKDAVLCASDSNLVGTYNSTNKTLTASSNGVLTIDGINPPLDERVCLFGQTTATQNGIFKVSDTGSPTTPFILTRTNDFDTSAKITQGAYFFVTFGTTYANTQLLLTTANPITLDTTSLTFTVINALNNLTAVSPLVKTGNQLSLNINTASLQISSGQLQISSGYTGQSSITTLGTITTGVWNGSAVPILYGGTGATSVSQAKTNFGWASSGANSDITSLSGLTTALSVAQGGTGGTNASQAKTNLGFLTKFSQNIASGTVTVNIAHNLGTFDILDPIFRDTVTNAKLYNVKIDFIDVNTIAVDFGFALANVTRVTVAG